MRDLEEEIKVLTAQVNAYSHEVDKQKRLVTQSQVKHKTEVFVLLFYLPFILQVRRLMS